MDKSNNNLEYYKLLQGLKKVVRYQPHPNLHESVAGHSYMAVMLANDIIDEYNLNLNKNLVLNILLVHDLPEVGMSFDYPAPETANSQQLSLHKKKLENSKIESIGAKFSRPKLKTLFTQFELMESREAQFANLIDKLESQIYVLTNKCAGFTTNQDYEFIINYTSSYVSYFPELSDLINQIKNELTNLYLNFKKNADN